MSSVSKPQGADLAKINYQFLRQADPKAVLNVDSDGQLHALKSSNSIFQSWVFGSAAPNAKRVEQTKINARVWGHLIPQIKELQAKETLSVRDADEVQQMLGELELVREEVERFRKECPEYVERFEKLLKKMDKRLQEQACRYVGQTPPNEDEKRMEEIRDELHKIKELVVEAKQTDAEAPEKPAPAAKEEQSESVASRVGAFFDAAADMGSSAFSTALYGSAGVASGVLQAGLFPLRVAKGTVGILLAPNLVQRALGISNFEKGWEELMKSRVCIPDTVGGKRGVAYMGPLEVEEELPELRGVVGLLDGAQGAVAHNLPEMLANRLPDDLQDDPAPIHIVRPRAVITTSLEGKTWEHNPLWGRVKTCGAEWATGSAKMAFWVLAATYLLGWYGNEHGKCADECDLAKGPTFWGAVSDSVYLKFYGERTDRNACANLQMLNQTRPEEIARSYQSVWKRNYCDGVPEGLTEQISEKHRVCDGLTETYDSQLKKLENAYAPEWRASGCDDFNFKQLEEEYESRCYDLKAGQEARSKLLNEAFEGVWRRNACDDLPPIPVQDAVKCQTLLTQEKEALLKLQRTVAEGWEKNYCEDPEPKPMSDLWSDMMKNPWKYPMNFAKTVDEWGSAAGDKLSNLKGPGKVVLRGLVKIGQTLNENHTRTFHGMEYIAFAGIAGSSILNMRKTKSYVGWLASATTAAAAFAAMCALDPLNDQAVALYYDLTGRVVNMTEALLA